MVSANAGRHLGVIKHTGGAEEGGAGVAAGDGHDGGHHQVLDEGARHDDLHALGDGGHVEARRVHILHHVLRKRAVGAEELKVARLPSGLGLLVKHICRECGLERVLELDVLVLVLLFIVNDNVVHVLDLGLGHHGGRAHPVELADLGGALEHLHGVGVVRDLVPEWATGKRASARCRGAEAGLGCASPSTHGVEVKTPRPRKPRAS